MPRKPKNITGQRFGKLTVIQFEKMVSYGGQSQSTWLCKCDCGASITLPLERLRRGTVTECTECATGMIGLRVGQLEVLKPLQTKRYAGQRCSYWLCMCHGCGRLGEYPKVLLTHPDKKVTCCSVCRKGPCQYCGSEILSNKRSTTNFCSAFCKQQHKNLTQAVRVAERTKENKNYWKEQYRLILERRNEDAELDEHYKAISNENAKKYYHRNREKRLAYWRESQRQKALASLLGIGQQLMELKDEQ